MTSPEFEHERKRVYEAILSKFFNPGDVLYLRSRPVELPDNTEGVGSGDPFEGYTFPEKKSGHIPLSINRVDVVIVDSLSIEKLFANGCEEGWVKFHQTYTESKILYGLSDVGFKNNGTEAIVYVELGSDCLLGLGSIIRLTRQNGQWKVAEAKSIWGSY